MWTLLLLVGCQGDGSAVLGVFAASSLTEAFTDLEADFEAAHPGTDVVASFAGSQVLRLQIEQGAPADVFASADARHVEALVDAGWLADSRVFAHNALVVAVPADNPAGLARFADLPRASRIVIGAPTVPAGTYAREVLRRAGPDFEAAVLARVVSEEANVRLVLAKVALGEADAALVYRTDAAATDAVRTLPVPEAYAVRADYLAGRVVASDEPALAGAWLDYLGSPAGRAVLDRHGFTTDP